MITEVRIYRVKLYIWSKQPKTTPNPPHLSLLFLFSLGHRVPKQTQPLFSTLHLTSFLINTNPHRSPEESCVRLTSLSNTRFSYLRSHITVLMCFNGGGVGTQIEEAQINLQLHQQEEEEEEGAGLPESRDQSQGTYTTQGHYLEEDLKIYKEIKEKKELKQR